MQTSTHTTVALTIAFFVNFRFGLFRHSVIRFHDLKESCWLIVAAAVLHNVALYQNDIFEMEEFQQERNHGPNLDVGDDNQEEAEATGERQRQAVVDNYFTY